MPSPPARRTDDDNHFDPRMSTGRRIGLAAVFLFFLVGGIAHFALTEVEMRIVPPWFPWPREAVLVSGVFELLGAAGLPQVHPNGSIQVDVLGAKA